MICPKCGISNPREAAFCANCGGSLSKVGSGFKESSSSIGVGDAKKKLPIVPIVVGVVVLALVVLGALLLPKMFGGSNTVLNDSNIYPQQAAEGTLGYGSSDLGIGFLYPDACLLSDHGSNGVYVYTSGSQGIPYIQVSTSAGKVNVQKYFKDCQKEMKKDYKEVEFEDVKRVIAGEKTLYMMRSMAFVDGVDQVIDRYIEPYDKLSVVYTVKSTQAKSEDGDLKVIIESLRLDTYAYVDEVAQQNPQGQSDTPAGNYQTFSSSSGHFSIACDMDYVSDVYEDESGVDIVLLGLEDDEDAVINVNASDFSADGYTEAQPFLEEYRAMLAQEEDIEAAEVTKLGGSLGFYGFQYSFSDGVDDYLGYVLAGSSNGIIYTIAYDCLEANDDLYWHVASDLVGSMQVE